MQYNGQQDGRRLRQRIAQGCKINDNWGRYTKGKNRMIYKYTNMQIQIQIYRYKVEGRRFISIETDKQKEGIEYIQIQIGTSKNKV